MSDKKEKLLAYTGTNHTGSSASSPYGISRLSPAIVLADVNKSITSAGKTVIQVSNAKLDIIVKQIEVLKAEAEKIILNARHDVALHQAKCAFDKKIGHVYHLYKKKDGSTQWSILSFEDWMGHPPWEYIGSYELMGDQTWRDINLKEPEQPIDFTNLILEAVDDKLES